MCDRPRDPLQPDRRDDEPDLDDQDYIQGAWEVAGPDDWQIELHIGDRDETLPPALGDTPAWVFSDEFASAEWELEAAEWEAEPPSAVPSEFGAPRCAGRTSFADNASPGDYSAYLASAEWCRKRYDRHWLDQATCCRCGIRAEQVQALYRAGGHRGAPFHCHHLTPESRGRERSADLRTLCCYCHIDVTREGPHRARMALEYGERPGAWSGTPLPDPEWEIATEEGARRLWDDHGLIDRLRARQP